METQIYILIMFMLVSCGYAAKPQDEKVVSNKVSSERNAKLPVITKLETESNTVSGNGGILTVKIKTDSKGKVVIRTATDHLEAKECYPTHNCKKASKDLYTGDIQVNTEQTIKIKGSDLYSNYNRLYLSVTNQVGLTEGKFFYITRDDEAAFSYIQPVNEVVRGDSLVARITANKRNAKVYYQIGNGKTQEYNAKVGIQIEHPIPQFHFNFPVSITYYSVDEAGNIEFPKKKFYTIVPTETKLTGKSDTSMSSKGFY